MFTEYLKIAWRNIRRHKLNTVLNLTGLTLGIACFLVIFAKVNYETSFDGFHSDADRIHRVVRVTSGLAYLEGDLEYRTGVFFPLPNAIESQIPELEAVTQMMYIGGGVVEVLDSQNGTALTTFNEDNGIIFLKPDFFEMFDFAHTEFGWIAGSPQTSLTEPNSVVLTETIARKYFGDENPIGQSIRAMDVDLQVSGIVRDFPQNSDFPLQLLISQATLESMYPDLMSNWGPLSDSFQCYVKLQESVTVGEIEQSIKNIYAGHATPEMAESRLFKLQPLRDVHSDARFGNYNYRVISKSTILSLASIGILLILMACINHSNLTVAQLSSRAKTAGVLKIFGSDRKKVIIQFFSETLILTLVAAGLSLLIANEVLGNLPYLIGLPQENWRFISFQNLWYLPVIVLAISVLAGIYPALLISRANPVELIRNKGFKTGKTGPMINRITVIFQFVVAQVLIVCTLIVFKQLSYIESKDMGYERENIVTVGLPDNDSVSLERFKNSLMQHSNITDISFASIIPGRSASWVDVSRNISSTPLTTVTEIKAVDSDYLSTFGLDLISGRNFNAQESDLSIIVNQKLIKDLHFEDESQATGSVVNFAGETATIIGVVKDFNSGPIYESIRPCVLVNFPDQFSMAGIKYTDSNDGMAAGVQFGNMIAEIRGQWESLFPGRIFEYQIFDETIASYYREEQRIATLINIFTGIMIFICCLGIIGLIHHATNKRTKELAVRKVVGASVANIMTLLVSGTAKWVVTANVIAWPVAWYVMNKWLQNFAYHTNITVGSFLLSGALALGIALLTVSWHAIRAATANPTESLRYE